MINIIHAKTREHLEQIRALFIEYQKFLNVDLCFQGFNKELNMLPAPYAPPDGCLLLALDEASSVGCIALKKLGDNICEMKRLFVRSGYRKQGYGKLLAEEIIKQARFLNYEKMRLDTLNVLKQAMHLYESLGFKKIDAYYSNPLPDVVYWELDLYEKG